MKNIKFGLHCLSAFRAFPAFRQSPLRQSPFSVFIAFRRSGRSPLRSADLRSADLSSVFIAFRRSGRSPHYVLWFILTDWVQSVFIAFRRSGRSPHPERRHWRSSDPSRLHCLSAFRAFPASTSGHRSTRQRHSLHCLSAFRAFPAGARFDIRVYKQCWSSLPFGVQGVPRRRRHRQQCQPDRRSSLPFGVQGVPRGEQLLWRHLPFRGRLHCLSAFRAFPAVKRARRSAARCPVFIAFRRSGRSPQARAMIKRRSG